MLATGQVEGAEMEMLSSGRRQACCRLSNMCHGKSSVKIKQIVNVPVNVQDCIIFFCVFSMCLKGSASRCDSDVNVSNAKNRKRVVTKAISEAKYKRKRAIWYRKRAI